MSIGLSLLHEHDGMSRWNENEIMKMSSLSNEKVRKNAVLTTLEVQKDDVHGLLHICKNVVVMDASLALKYILIKTILYFL